MGRPESSPGSGRAAGPYPGIHAPKNPFPSPPLSEEREQRVRRPSEFCSAACRLDVRHSLLPNGAHQPNRVTRIRHETRM